MCSADTTTWLSKSRRGVWIHASQMSIQLLSKTNQLIIITRINVHWNWTGTEMSNSSSSSDHIFIRSIIVSWPFFVCKMKNLNHNGFILVLIQLAIFISDVRNFVRSKIWSIILGKMTRPSVFCLNPIFSAVYLNSIWKIYLLFSIKQNVRIISPGFLQHSVLIVKLDIPIYIIVSL